MTNMSWDALSFATEWYAGRGRIVNPLAKWAGVIASVMACGFLFLSIFVGLPAKYVV